MVFLSLTLTFLLLPNFANGFLTNHTPRRTNRLHTTRPSCMSERPMESVDSVSRRSIVLSSLITVTTIASSATAASIPKTPATTSKLTTVQDAIRMIGSSCNRKFLNNVVSSDYRFIYRGIGKDASTSSPTIRSEPCDLLSESTYESAEASRSFRRLDERMKNELIRPSNGHLATTSVVAAADRGEVVSVWPLGEDCHFAWLEKGGDFWPGGSSGKIIVDGLNCGQLSLDDALRSDRSEIMFRAEEFLAVPVSLEKDLRAGLRQSFFI